MSNMDDDDTMALMPEDLKWILYLSQYFLWWLFVEQSWS
jgi:hypothetical protein